MGIIGPPVANASSLGLTNPKSSPYNARMDGVTDDTEAFKKLHEDINSGLISGYYLTGPAVIISVLPTIKKTCEIRFFNGAFFDATKATWGKLTKSVINIEGSLGVEAALTEEAVTSSFKLACATAFADGTLLKLFDKKTEWDESQKAKVAEIVEVGRPDGALAGINGSINTAAGIKAGEKLTGVAMTNLNPLEPGGESIVPAAGSITIGGDTFTYESFTTENNTAKFKLIGEQEATENHPQGTKVTVVSPAGTVFLRTPVTHEKPYTVANESTVVEVKPVEDVIIDCPQIHGAGSEAWTIGISVRYGRNCNINHPTIKNCWVTCIKYIDTLLSHIENPLYENSRVVEYGTSGLLGYGTNFSFSTQDCEVLGGRSIRTRHAYTQGGTSGEQGGLPRRNMVINHIAESTFADAFDSHGGAYDVTLIGCKSINSSSQALNINCPKCKVIGFKGIKAAGAGASFKNITLGAAEYDIDIEMLEPRATNAFGLKVSAATSTTFGKETKWLRIRGFFDTCAATAIEVLGSGEGAGINWFQKNVDIDVTIRGGATAGGSHSILVAACEGLTINARISGAEKGRTLVLLRDCKNFTVDCACEWTAESAANVGISVTVGAGGAAKGSIKGVIREGPMTNRATGKSTTLDNNTTNVFVYPGPDEAVALGTGEGNQKVTVP